MKRFTRIAPDGSGGDGRELPDSVWEPLAEAALTLGARAVLLVDRDRTSAEAGLRAFVARLMRGGAGPPERFAVYWFTPSPARSLYPEADLMASIRAFAERHHGETVIAIVPDIARVLGRGADETIRILRECRSRLGAGRQGATVIYGSADSAFFCSIAKPSNSTTMRFVHAPSALGG